MKIDERIGEMVEIVVVNCSLPINGSYIQSTYNLDICLFHTNKITATLYDI